MLGTYDYRCYSLPPATIYEPVINPGDLFSSLWNAAGWIKTLGRAFVLLRSEVAVT